MGRRAGQVGDTVLVGVVGVLWYALPDVVASRRRRGLLKAALIVAGGAYTWWREDSAPVGGPEERDAPRAPGGAARVAPRPGTIAAHVADGPVLSPAALGLPVDAEGRFLAGADSAALRYGAAVAGIVLPVLVESAVHRFGARLAARGVSAPHTRVALVMGPLGALAVSLAQTRRARL